MNAALWTSFGICLFAFVVIVHMAFKINDTHPFYVWRCKSILAADFKWPMWFYGYRCVSQDKYGKLWWSSERSHMTMRMYANRRDKWGEMRASFAFVEVKDPSTHKIYFLRVPTFYSRYRVSIITPQQAVAWTFGVPPWDYKPTKET